MFKSKHFNNEAKEMQLLDHIILSGRYKLWLETLKFIENRPLLGYGSMSDRIVINKKRLVSKDILNPVSNIFLYSTLSGGLICLALLIIFFILIRKNYLNIIFFSKLENNKNKIATMILLMISLRMMVENSFMLFGIDFILLLNSLYLTQKK